MPIRFMESKSWKGIERSSHQSCLWEVVSKNAPFYNKSGLLKFTSFCHPLPQTECKNLQPQLHQLILRHITQLSPSWIPNPQNHEQYEMVASRFGEVCFSAINNKINDLFKFKEYISSLCDHCIFNTHSLKEYKM